ncbi:HAD family hydrolase [Neobacillus sp. D3-1R]|uniref:HAD family hydrolase n=1 Tax=Neobacillus sp. D3-1R TaxID=3445778 RepID=UPI003FA1090B
MAIKAIFLDFYGTVVHEEEASLIEICHKIKEESDTESSFEEIGYYWMKQFNQVLNNSHGEKFLKQRDVSTTSLQNTLAHFQSSAKEEELLELMFSQWKSPAIYEDAVEFFEKNTLPVYILSNVDSSDIMEAIQLLNIKVDGVVTSEDVKVYKPHRDMFNHALELSGYSPEEVLHVGDSLTSDVLGANQVGINSVWLNRQGKAATGDSKPNFVVKNLNEVLDIPALIKI